MTEPSSQSRAASLDVLGLLREAWRRVLGSVPADADDFFALGGDSLMATAVAADLSRLLGLRVEPGWLYDHPRFRDAVAAVQRHLDVPQAGDDAIRRRGRRGTHPLSYQQEGQLALDDRVRGAHRYAPVYAAAFSPVDVGRLRDVVATISLRHPALRTGLCPIDGRWRQRIDDRPLNLAVLDGGDDPAAAARTWAASGFRFDGNGLARFALITGPQQHMLVLAADQMVIDPWGIVLREAARLYNDPAGLAELPLAYSDYARWQHEHIAAGYTRHLEFWRHQIEGLPAYGVAVPGAVAAAAAGPAATIEFALSQTTTSAIRSLAAARRATMFQVLLALFGVALNRWIGRPQDLLLGSRPQRTSWGSSSTAASPGCVTARCRRPIWWTRSANCGATAMTTISCRWRNSLSISAAPSW